MKRFASGLVVGKFAPLHHGHEALIEHAAQHCEQLLLMTWSRPEIAGCGPGRRARWLHARFPQHRTLVITEALAHRWHQRGLISRELPFNNAPEQQQRAFVAEVCSGVLGTSVDAVFSSEAYGDGLAAVLSTHFGHAVSHVCVDPQRSTLPTSGTAIRADLHGHRQWLSASVYASFVQRICLLGGESTGKTVLAAQLAEHLGTLWAPEFGRELWEQRQGRLSLDDLLLIARTQIAREQQLATQATRWLVCDTSPLTTACYSALCHQYIDPLLACLAKRRYALTLLCANDFPFVQDGTRAGIPFQQRQQRWHLNYLHQHNIPFVTLHGTPPQRLQQALEAVDSLR